MTFRDVLQSLKIALAIVIILECISSIAFYQKHKGEAPVFSTVKAIDHVYHNYVLYKFFPEEKVKSALVDKFDYLIKKRRQYSIYPAYTYDPQLHNEMEPLFLANLSDTKILYCEEDEGIVTFQSDEFGFRNPRGNYGVPVDLLLIGDSSIEGACVADENTIAGLLRSAGFSVLNLGRGGTGPLFQLAILREYAKTQKIKTVIWFVQVGNDMRDLREEKTSIVSKYLNPAFTQNLMFETEKNDNKLRAFLDLNIALERQRREDGQLSPYSHARGETLDELEVIHKEVHLLKRVAQTFLNDVTEMGSKLKVVLIPYHGGESYEKREIRKFFSAFTKQNEIELLDLTMSDLPYEPFWAKKGNHLNSTGYKKMVSLITERLVLD